MFKKITVCLLISAMAAVCSFAAPPDKPAPPPKPPCSTHSNMDVTLDPAQLSYTLYSAAAMEGTVTVHSPPVQTNGTCDQTLPYVYGNSANATDFYSMNVALRVTSVLMKIETAEGDDWVEVMESLPAGLIGIIPSTVTLYNPGTGSADADFFFDPDLIDSVAPGEYLVHFQAQATGLGVGTGNANLAITIARPTRVDTLPPEVAIFGITNGLAEKLGKRLDFTSTAMDPYEEGAGTGVTAFRAALRSAGGSFSAGVPLAFDKSFTVPAGETVTGSGSVNVSHVGSYILSVEADDGASHTGSAQAGFSVTAVITWMPPLVGTSKPNTVKSNIVVPWTMADYAGNLLPYNASSELCIVNDSAYKTCFVIGSGKGYLSYDPLTGQYKANWKPSDLGAAAGSYTAQVFIPDVDGTKMLQGSYPITVNP